MSESSDDDLSDQEAEYDYITDSSASYYEGSVQSDFSLISNPAHHVLSRSISSVSSLSTGSELAEEVEHIHLESGLKDEVNSQTSGSELAEEVAHLNLQPEDEAKEVVSVLTNLALETKEVGEKVEGLLTKAKKVCEDIEKKEEEKKGTEVGPN